MPFRLLGFGCCRSTAGHGIQSWDSAPQTGVLSSRKVNVSTTEDCKLLCQKRPRCDAFEVIGGASSCWHFYAAGQSMRTLCDRESGMMLCFVKDRLRTRTTAAATPSFAARGMLPHALYTGGAFAIGFDGLQVRFTEGEDVVAHLRRSICTAPPGADVPSIHASYVSARVPNTFCADAFFCTGCARRAHHPVHHQAHHRAHHRSLAAELTVAGSP